MPKKRRAAPNRARWAIAGGGVLLVVLVVAVVLLAGGGGTERTGPRALTEDEANRLAITRFRNYEAQARTVTITVPNPAGRLTITGSIDYRDKFGYGVVQGEQRSASGEGLIGWSLRTVRVHPMPNAPARAPETPPATGWVDRPLQSAGSALDSALTIALGLGNDRPDNAQLLPQNGATWIGREQLAGRQVEVMAGPSARAKPGTAGNVRYWLGGDGTMYRVQVRVASEPDPVVIDFGARKDVPVRRVPGLVLPR